MRNLLLVITAVFAVSIGRADDIPPEVKRLKGQRDRQVAKITKEIDTAYYRELDKLKKKYAVQENYTAAAYIEKMQIAYIDEKTTDTGEIDRNQRAKVYYKVPKTLFRNEARAVPDSNNPAIFFNIPEVYSGWNMSLRSTGPLTFKVRHAGVVTLATHEDANRHLGRLGWEEVGSFNSGKDSPRFKFLIFEKHLDVGEYEINGEGAWGAPRILAGD